MPRNWFIFYHSFAEAGRNLPPDLRLEFYDRIVALGIDGEEKGWNPVCDALLMLVKPQLEANNRRFEIGVENGSKWGQYGHLWGKYWHLGWRPKKQPENVPDWECQDVEETPQKPPKNPPKTPPKDKVKDKDKVKGKEKGGVGEGEREEGDEPPDDSAQAPHPKSFEERFFALYSDWQKVGTDPELGKLIAEKCHVDLKERSKDLLDFANYWGQKGSRDRKQHWQKQRTFDLFARIRTWLAKRDENPKAAAAAESAKTEAARQRIEANEKAEAEARKAETKRERERLVKALIDMPEELRQQIRKQAIDELAAVGIVDDPNRDPQKPNVFQPILEWRMLNIVSKRIESQ